MLKNIDKGKVSFRKVYALNPEILSVQRQIKSGVIDGFDATHNGQIIINPKIDVKDDFPVVSSFQRGHFHTYHSILRLDFPEQLKYTVLSSSLVIFNPSIQKFYIYKRPDDSQEDAGELDVIGGYVSLDNFYDDTPFISHVNSRLEKKSGLKGINLSEDDLIFLGINNFKSRMFHDVSFLLISEDDIFMNSKLGELSIETARKIANSDDDTPLSKTLGLVFSNGYAK